MLTKGRERRIESGPQDFVDQLFSNRFSDTFHTRRYFGASDSRKLIDFHRRIADKFQVENPYFRFTTAEPRDKDGLLLDVKDYLPHVGLRIGPLHAFSSRMIAAMVHDQVRTYVLRGTMGDFPIGDTDSEERLIAVMIGGYSKDTLLVSFNAWEDEAFKPLVGGKIVFGEPAGIKPRLIPEINGRPEAVIPTFSAVSIDSNILSQSVLGTISEHEVVGISRFYSQSRDTLELLGLNPKVYDHLPLYTIAYFALAYHGYALRSKLEIPKFAIYDTHLPKLVALTVQKFGAVEIASGENVEPTEAVQTNILRHHYGYYKGGITVAAFPTEVYLTSALKLLDGRPIIAG